MNKPSYVLYNVLATVTYLVQRTTLKSIAKVIKYLGIVANAKYMASSRTRILIGITNINKPQIVSKMPDTAICYIHC